MINSAYPIGHCPLRRDVRLFAIDRIERVTASHRQFEVPRGFDAEAFMRSSFGVFQGQPVSVTIRFGPEAAGYVKEKIWHPSQHLTDEPDGSVLFRAKVAGIHEIKLWVLKWGASAEALGPKQLRLEIAKEVTAMVKRYHRKPVV